LPSPQFIERSIEAQHVAPGAAVGEDVLRRVVAGFHHVYARKWTPQSADNTRILLRIGQNRQHRLVAGGAFLKLRMVVNDAGREIGDKQGDAYAADDNRGATQPGVAADVRVNRADCNRSDTARYAKEQDHAEGAPVVQQQEHGHDTRRRTDQIGGVEGAADPGISFEGQGREQADQHERDDREDRMGRH